MIRLTKRPAGWIYVAAMLLGAPAIAQEVIPGAALTWQLDIEFRDPQRLMVRLPGESQPRTYWYVIYRVTNNTGQDVQYLPSARLVTDTLDVVRAGDNVPVSLYHRIAALHRRDYPFFARPTKVSGLLLQGEENARTSAFVFPDFDPEATTFTVFISGLSGLIDRIPNPAFDTDQPASEDNPRSFTRRLTLGIEYVLPGDERTRSGAQPKRRNRHWVMR